MFPWREFGLLALRSFGEAFTYPPALVPLGVMTMLVLWQDVRLAQAEARWAGRLAPGFWRRLGYSLAYGLLGGVFATAVLSVLGVDLAQAGVMYMLPLALAFILIDPRLACFAYAGGIVSLSVLLFGWPHGVSVPSLMALVGVLHLTESALIWIAGAETATPVFVGTHDGRVVGGYSMTQFWLVPLAVILGFQATGGAGTGSVSMPDWWPILRPLPEVATASLVYVLFPTAAAIGYGDVAVSASPEAQARETGAHLFLYSAALVIIAVASQWWRPLAWVAALFGPFGHEALARLGMGAHREGYLWPPVADGVRVLAVDPASALAIAGVRPLDIITSVNDVPVGSRLELYELLVAFSPLGRLRLAVRRGDQEIAMFVEGPFFGPEWGFVPGPEPGDTPTVVLRPSEGRLVRWVRRWLGRLFSWRKDGPAREG